MTSNIWADIPPAAPRPPPPPPPFRSSIMCCVGGADCGGFIVHSNKNNLLYLLAPGLVAASGARAGWLVVARCSATVGVKLLQQLFVLRPPR